MKFLVVADFRENFPSESESVLNIYNDHPSRENIFNIIEYIRELGYECEYFGGIPELISAVNNNQKFTDCFFINLTDGLTQPYNRTQAPVLLDILNVPFSGNGILGSTLMNNKYYTKISLNQNPNVLLPPDMLITEYIPLDEDLLEQIGFPVIIKPNLGGSSIDIDSSSVCTTIEETRQKINILLTKHKELIIEKYIYGIDITNFIIGNNKNYCINEIIVSELTTNNKFPVYGAVEKNKKLRKLYDGNLKLDKEILSNIYKTSDYVFSATEASDIARIDYRLENVTNKLYFLEINSAPRFSETSEIGFIAKQKKLHMRDIIYMYINTAINRYNIIL